MSVDAIDTRRTQIFRRLENNIDGLLCEILEPRPAVMDQRNRARDDWRRERRTRKTRGAAVIIRDEDQFTRRHEEVIFQLVFFSANAAIRKACFAGTVRERRDVFIRINRTNEKEV